MRTLAVLGFALAFCAALPASSDAPGGSGSGALFAPPSDTEPFQLESESLEYESKRKLYVARGGPDGQVLLRQGNRALRADWVAYSRTTGRAVASGNVRFTDGTDTLRTEFVEFDIATLEGVLFDAEFVGQSTPLELHGGEIRKTGRDTYLFKRGRFTACRCPDPESREPWEVRAESADLEVEGYGTARNTTLEVLGVPVVWLPWMMYPLKTERQSGLLFPQFGISQRNGVDIGLPIFIAAGDPVNLTLTPRWLQKRGPKGDLEIDYVAGERSGGAFFGSGLHDQDVEPDSLETPFGKGRWGTTGTHDVFLPEDVRFAAQYAFASDNAYPNDFNGLAAYRVDRFLPAGAFASGDLGLSGVAGGLVGAQYFNDLQNPDDTDRDRFLLNRLPEARLHTLAAELPLLRWLVPSLDVRYAWFQQEELPERAYSDTLLVTDNGRFLDTGVDGLPTCVNGPTTAAGCGANVDVEQGRNGAGSSAAVPDPDFDNFAAVTNPGGTEGDGIFQEGELLADSGQRVLFHPRVALPLRIADVVEFTPEIGWQETLYQSDFFGRKRRGFLTGRMDLSTRFRGRLGDAVHLVEPQVGWAWVDAPNQAGNPLYVPAPEVPQNRLRELDLDNVTRNWADRIPKYQAVTLGVANRFYVPGTGPGEASVLLADFVLQGLYDIENSKFGVLYLDGEAYPFPGTISRFSLGFDLDDAAITEGLLDVSWTDERGDALFVDYRYVREIPQFFEAFPEQNRRFKRFRRESDAIHQITAGARVAITRQWSVSYRVGYSFEGSLLLANTGSVDYVSSCGCWSAGVVISQSRSRGASLSFRYRFLGLGDTSNQSLRPSVSGPPSLLDAFGGV
ncbi:MAG: LPS assembly protein LptD [Myxococcota bacterium]|nr:LPS assembly protein LptD [Myxococcota bacterium]